jgi:hypothetical protein
MDYAQGPAAQMETLVFWSAPEFSPLITSRERLTRVAKVNVFAFQEPGEL